MSFQTQSDTETGIEITDTDAIKDGIINPEIVVITEKPLDSESATEMPVPTVVSVSLSAFFVMFGHGYALLAAVRCSSRDRRTLYDALPLFIV